MLGRYLSNLAMDHWKATKKVMQYLQRTKYYKLTSRSAPLEIIRYSNSDFTGFLDSGQSIFGYVFMLAKGFVLWKSIKQTLIAYSTMEVEFVACHKASNQRIWLRNFIRRLQIMDSIESLVKISCDNKVAKFYSKNNKNPSKSKHIDIKFFVVKESTKSLSIN